MGKRKMDEVVVEWIWVVRGDKVGGSFFFILFDVMWMFIMFKIGFFCQMGSNYGVVK